MKREKKTHHTPSESVVSSFFRSDTDDSIDLGSLARPFAAAGKQSRRDHLDEGASATFRAAGFWRRARRACRAQCHTRGRRSSHAQDRHESDVSRRLGACPPGVFDPRESHVAECVHHHPSFGAIHPAHRAIHRFFHPPSSRAGCRCEGRAAQWTELAQARGDRHGRVARAAPLQDGRALRAVHPPEDQRGTSSPRETYSLRSLRVPSRACAETSWNTNLAARRKCAVRSLRHTSLDANDRRSQRTIDRLSRPARVDLLFSSVGLTD